MPRRAPSRSTLMLQPRKPRNAVAKAVLRQGRTPGAAAVLSGRAGKMAGTTRQGRAAAKKAVRREIALLGGDADHPQQDDDPTLTDQLSPHLTIEDLKLAAQTFEKDVTRLSCCAA